MGVELETPVPVPSTAEEEQLQPSTLAVVSKISNEEALCIKQLRRLIKEDESVREAGVADDEELLLAFVRGKKCNVEKAFKCLQNHVYIMRVKYRKYFQSLSPQKFKYLLDASILKKEPKFAGLLKHTDREGRRVGVGQCELLDPRIHKTDDLMMGLITSGLELLRTEEAPKNGLVFVIDGAGFGFRHAKEFSMTRLYMFLSIFLSAYPVKYKGFHIMNNGYLFDAFLKIIKQLIPKKLRDRIHLHGSNYESLYKHVPREILPESFGGLLSEDEAFDYEIEKRILDKTEFYEKLGQNL